MVSASVISRGQITLTTTLVIWNITKNLIQLLFKIDIYHCCHWLDSHTIQGLLGKVESDQSEIRPCC